MVASQEGYAMEEDKWWDGDGKRKGKWGERK